jgi:hypothetical protein
MKRSGQVDHKGSTHVSESRKKAVSIRINASDVDKVKKLAKRLGVRDSDIVRFALRSMLQRLVPLADPEVRGRNLVPVFVESGVELLRYFDLDAARLDAIINASTGTDRRVEREDIALLALTGGQDSYAALKLSELNHQDEHQLRSGELSSSLRRYLYEKYVYRASRSGSGSGNGATSLHGLQPAHQTTGAD